MKSNAGVWAMSIIVEEADDFLTLLVIAFLFAFFGSAPWFRASWPLGVAVFVAMFFVLMAALFGAERLRSRLGDVGSSLLWFLFWIGLPVAAFLGGFSHTGGNLPW